MLSAMLAFARLHLPEGRLVDIMPGQLIGRLVTADVRINDPRVSEAHGLVSLRRGVLKLLALRGRLHVGGVALPEVDLQPGVTIGLAPGLELRVVSIGLPRALPAIEGAGLARQALPPVASLVGPQLVAGFVADAEALLWTDGDGFHLRVPGQADRELEPGDAFAVGARTYRLVELPLDLAGADATARDPLHGTPLTLQVRYDSVHVQRAGETLVIDGLPARIVTELALMRAPVDWKTLAAELWHDEPEEAALRQRWDGVINRLRKRLRDLGLPPDLVRADRRGRVELVLGPKDRIVDES